ARTCAPQDGPDAGEEFFEIEWLGQVVVGTVVQAANLVSLLTAGSQDENRCFTGVMKCPAQVKSADTRQHQIQHYQIGLESPRRCDRAAAVVDTLRVIALGEKVVEQGCGKSHVVLDDENPFLQLHREWSASLSVPRPRIVTTCDVLAQARA